MAEGWQGSTVKLDFKNRQDKNHLGLNNQIINDQLDQISFKNHQDKNQFDFKNQITNDQQAKLALRTAKIRIT